MENYPHPAYPPSYPDSGESSPRSREIDFENPQTPWDDQNFKAKFMCSYNGKIQPRTHDNQLSYVGGETKILAADRNIKFTSFISKLSSLIDAPEVSFKYQLPGEDLDALISVTNDDDLDHMMHEYDRLYRASARPSRMRLFLFVNDSPPLPAQSDPIKPNNADYLFGLEKPVVAPPPTAAVRFHDPVPEPVAPPPEYHIQHRQGLNPSDRVVGSDPAGVNHSIEIQMQRMQIAENERRKTEENRVGNYPTGDFYVQKVQEKFPHSNFPAAQGYWQERPVSGEVYPPSVSAPSAAPGGGDQAVYMIPAPGNYYHAPVMRPPVTHAPGNYYAVQRMASDGYREAPVYGGAPPVKPPFSSGVPLSLQPGQPVKGPAYAEGVSVVRQTGIPDNNNTGLTYAQVAYDSAGGRQVYYAAPGGGVHATPYHGVAPPGITDVRQGGVSLGQDVKVMNKISQGSV